MTSTVHFFFFLLVYVYVCIILLQNSFVEDKKALSNRILSKGTVWKQDVYI